jgi:thiosulfate dehydrogenase [quinone] large subunit
MASDDEISQLSRRLIEKYHLNVTEEVMASLYSAKPKIRMLLSRASFRAEAIRTPERAQRERRNFLRNIHGLAIISVPALLYAKAAFFSPSKQAPSYVTNISPGATEQKLLVNTANIPAGESLTLDDPTLGPFLLIHLRNNQFVAYSAICTHAGCQVQIEPSAQYIACPCHGAVYDPNNGTRVLSGPAPYPLQQISIHYDQSTGNIYLQ